MATTYRVTTNGTADAPPPSVMQEPRRTAQPPPPRVVRDPEPIIEPAPAQAQQAEPEESRPFFELLRSFSADEWEKHLVYLYRQEPITDRRAGGNTTVFLVKYTKPFDEQEVMLEQGSGKYQARLNRRSANGKDRTIARHEFLIENPNYPPKIPPGEWVDDPRNEKWSSWMKQTAEKAQAQKAPELNGMGEAFHFVRQIIQELRPDASQGTQAEVVRAVLEAVKDTRRELGGGQGQFIEAVKAFSPLIAPIIANMVAPRHHDDALLKVLLEQGANKDRLITELISTKANPAGSSMKDTLQTIAMLRDMFPNAAPADNSSMLNSLVQFAPALLSMFGRHGGPSGAPPMVPLMAPPMATPAAAPDMNQPAAAAPPIPETAMPNQPQPYTPQQLQHIQEIVMSNARTLYRFLNENRSGTDYADYFIEGNGQADYLTLKNFGYENLLLALQHVPLAWSVLQPIEPQFKVFMEAFYSWTPEQPQSAPDDEDEDDEPGQDHAQE